MSTVKKTEIEEKATKNEHTSVKTDRVQKSRKNAITVTYVGPTIKNIIRQNTTLLNGTMTSKMRTVFKEKPILRNLLISSKELGRALCSIEKKQGFIYEIYKKVEQEV